MVVRLTWKGNVWQSNALKTYLLNLKKDVVQRFTQRRGSCIPSGMVWRADHVGGTIEMQTCIEIECDGKQLLVVFNDFDGWCLGLAGSAWVVKDLKELPEW